MNGISPRGRLYSGLLFCVAPFGISGITFELSWIRQLEPVLGSTPVSEAMMLAISFTGIGLGSHFMGRRVQRFTRTHPLRILVTLELLLSAIVVAGPYALQALVAIQAKLWDSLGSMALAAPLIASFLGLVTLLPPAALLGATFPLLSELVSRDPSLTRHFVNSLYTAALAGALGGCVLCGLLLLPNLGTTQTVWAVTLLHFIVSCATWRLSTRLLNSFETEPQGFGRDQLPGTRLMQASEIEPSDSEVRALFGMLALSGFVWAVSQATWTRVLSLLLGPSVYVQTTVLCVALGGVLIGSWCGNKFFKNRALLFHALGLIHFAVVASTYLGIQTIEELSFVYSGALETIPSSPATRLGLQCLVSMGLILIPAVGLGSLVPILFHSLPIPKSGASAVLGSVMASQFLGLAAGIAGARLGLIPMLGTQRTLLVGVLFSCVLAAWAMSFMQRGLLRRSRRTVGAGLLTFGVASLALTTPWDGSMLTSAAARFRSGHRGLRHDVSLERTQSVQGEVVHSEEGAVSTVAVTRSGDHLALIVNGRREALVAFGEWHLGAYERSSQGDLKTQVLLAQLPLIFAEKSEEVLVIGLGSGITLGAVCAHPVQRIDCLESEPAVVEASRFFQDFNRKPLGDPRVHLVTDDARHHLLLSHRKYDVIISQASSPWAPDVARFFTREFFELSQQRLREGGLFCFRLSLDGLEREDLEVVLRGFGSVYSEVHLFRNESDVLILGSAKPMLLDLARTRVRWTEELARTMGSMGLASWETAFVHYWIGGQDLRAQLRGIAQNTDDHRIVEFRPPWQWMIHVPHPAARDLVWSRLYERASQGLIPHVKPDQAADPTFWLRLSDVSRRAGLPVEALRYARHALQISESGESVRAVALGLIANQQRPEALQLLGEHAQSLSSSAAFQRVRAEIFTQGRQWPEVLSAVGQWLRLAPTDARARYYLGVSQWHLNQPIEALATLEAVRSELWNDLDTPELPYWLGSLLAEKGRWSEAVACFETFLQRAPEHLASRLSLIEGFNRLGLQSEAIYQCRLLVQSTSEAGDTVMLRGVDSLQRAEYPAAAVQLERARTLKPWDPEIALRLAYAQEQQGDLKAATATLETFQKRTPDRPQIVGYLSGLLRKQQLSDRSKAMADRYRVLTGESWDAR